jgi:hypothetical protein
VLINLPRGGPPEGPEEGWESYQHFAEIGFARMFFGPCRFISVLLFVSCGFVSRGPGRAWWREGGSSLADLGRIFSKFSGQLSGPETPPDVSGLFCCVFWWYWQPRSSILDPFRNDFSHAVSCYAVSCHAVQAREEFMCPVASFVSCVLGNMTRNGQRGSKYSAPARHDTNDNNGTDPYESQNLENLLDTREPA